MPDRPQMPPPPDGCLVPPFERPNHPGAYRCYHPSGLLYWSLGGWFKDHSWGDRADWVHVAQSLSQEVTKKEARIKELKALEPNKKEQAVLWASISKLVQLCHSRSKAAGWHDTAREKGTMIALIHSEVSEALEGARKGLKDDHLPHRLMEEVEMADAVIRICDYCGAHGLDLAGAIAEKLEYNLHREDHKKENRQQEGGKRF